MPPDAPGSGHGPAAASHRALREIRRELERHPVVSEARGFPPETHSRLEAHLYPERLDRDVESASLEVSWFAGETTDAPPQFTFHYSDGGGVDFGWHHEPNPHVDGWGHFQYRAGPSEEYSSDPYSVSTTVPARVVWEILERLREVTDDQ